MRWVSRNTVNKTSAASVGMDPAWRHDFGQGPCEWTASGKSAAVVRAESLPLLSFRKQSL